MAGKQRREKEKQKRAEALAQSMDKLLFLGEVRAPEATQEDIQWPVDARDADEE